MQIFQKCSEKISALPIPEKNVLGFLWGRFSTPQSQWYRAYFGWDNTLSQTDFQDTIRSSVRTEDTSSCVSPDILHSDPKTWYEHTFSPLTSQEKQLIEQFFATMDKKVFFSIGNMTHFPKILGTCLAFASFQTKASFVMVTSDTDRYTSVLSTISAYFPISFSVHLESSAYISIDHFFSYLFSQKDITFSELIFFSKTTLWLFETKTGNLDELLWYPQEGKYRIFLESSS